MIKLLTTQYLDEADHLADQIVIIGHGKAVASGTPAELKRRVGGNMIETQVRSPEDLPAVAQALDRAGAATPHVDEATRRVSLAVEGGAEVLTVALRSLAAANVAVDDVALRAPTLNEAFLALTGHDLEQPAGAEHQPDRYVGQGPEE